MTRLIVMDTTDTTGEPYYRARQIIEPSMTFLIPWDLTHQGLNVCDSIGGWFNNCKALSYETHAIDVDNNFNVYIALKGKNNAVVEYKFNPTPSDPSLIYDDGTLGYSFTAVNGWSEASSANYSDIMSSGQWTSANLTNNVSRPDGVAAYPNMLKQSMESGVTCQGCSTEGAVEPSTCNTQVSQTNNTQYQKINKSLLSSNIVPGTPIVNLKGTAPPVFQPNFVSTNITASLRFEYSFTIQGTGLPPFTINKLLNITSYSNNLNDSVEGGGDYFELMSPNYPERPATTPSTLPYLSYDYYSNRFFYKHFAMMDNVTDAEGNVNTMGPSQPGSGMAALLADISRSAIPASGAASSLAHARILLQKSGY